MNTIFRNTLVFRFANDSAFQRGFDNLLAAVQNTRARLDASRHQRSILKALEGLDVHSLRDLGVHERPVPEPIHLAWRIGL